MSLFVQDNCADVYLHFSFPYLALNLFESMPIDNEASQTTKKEEGISISFYFDLVPVKHYHFAIKGRLCPYCQTAPYCTAETVQYWRPSAQSRQCHRGSYSNLCIHLPTISGK